MSNSNIRDRRQFVATLGIGTAASWLAFRHQVAAATVTRSANQQLGIACIGVGGKGESDMIETSAGHNIVAICDIDESRLAKAAERFPNAKKYVDWRKMLDQQDIDAVTISTPDHMHAPATLTAMKLGKHVFTQKPLTHSIYEARQLAHAAETSKLVTQMGTQHHSAARIKNAVQIIADGVIGKVTEVHAWTDRPGNFWKQGLQRPAGSQPVPGGVHWDLWIGVAPERPFHPGVYHPFHWRGWWDFGTGAGGDMACHILDPVFTALELGAPLTVSAEGPEPDSDSGPLWCQVTYKFAGTPRTSENLNVIWYEAGRQPDRALFKAPADWAGSDNGILFVGERGNLFVGFPEPPQLFPVGEFSDYQMPNHAEDNHYTQWTKAILGEGQTCCPFEYAGPLTEAVLLGNVSFRTQKTIDWDARLMVAKGNEAAESLIRRTYRQGWEVEGL
ncbi:MAG: Gfo/Idh/MocA family oxidoreductase [Planctomycetaceae bacterium]|nr:Gfo/Idh/MocA family oxidoreductase [Planctomycetaceae bacterium]